MYLSLGSNNQSEEMVVEEIERFAHSQLFAFLVCAVFIYVLYTICDHPRTKSVAAVLRSMLQKLARIITKLRLKDGEDPLAEELSLNRPQTKIAAEELRESMIDGKSLSAGEAAKRAGVTSKTAVKYLEAMDRVYEDVTVVESEGGRVWKRRDPEMLFAKHLSALRRDGWRGPLLIASLSLLLISSHMIVLSDMWSFGPFWPIRLFELVAENLNDAALVFFVVSILLYVRDLSIPGHTA
jgi:hypothetical protein